MVFPAPENGTNHWSISVQGPDGPAGKRDKMGSAAGVPLKPRAMVQKPCAAMDVEVDDPQEFMQHLLQEIPMNHSIRSSDSFGRDHEAWKNGRAVCQEWRHIPLNQEILKARRFSTIVTPNPYRHTLILVAHNSTHFRQNDNLRISDTVATSR